KAAPCLPRPAGRPCKRRGSRSARRTQKGATFGSLFLPRLVIGQLFWAQRSTHALFLEAFGKAPQRSRQFPEIADQMVDLRKRILAEILHARPRVRDHCVETLGPALNLRD